MLVLRRADVVLSLGSVIDIKAERERLGKQVEESRGKVARLEAKLADSQFLSKAPPVAVERERQKLSASMDELERLKEQLAQLG